MFGELEVWRLVRAAESEARAQNQALRIRMQFVAQSRPGPLRRLLARLQPSVAVPPSNHPDGRLEQPTVRPIVRRTTP